MVCACDMDGPQIDFHQHVAVGQLLTLLMPCHVQTGGLPSIIHNEMRDLLALTMSEECFDVATEPNWNQATIRLSMKAMEWTL